jgi:hypothetical protein
MAKVTIDGCIKTHLAGTVSEWTTVLLTIVAVMILTHNKELESDKKTVMWVLIGVLVAAMVLAPIERSCKDKIEEVNRLTSPDLEPTCVKTHTGFTTFQLAYVALAAFACVIVRQRTAGRILAMTLGGIAVVSSSIGMIARQRCSSDLK